MTDAVMDETRQKEKEAIEDMNSSIQRRKEKDQELIEATKSFFFAFDKELFELDLGAREIDNEASYSKGSWGEGNLERVVVDSKKSTIYFPKIVSKEKEEDKHARPLVTVEVSKKYNRNSFDKNWQWVAKLGDWGERGTTKPNVASKKAKEKLQSARDIKEGNRLQEKAMVEAQAILEARYPDYKVERKSHGNGFEIEANNNVRLEIWACWSDGKTVLHQPKVSFGTGIDPEEVFKTFAK